MNRVEFMQQLERLLWDIPENDRVDAIAYYNDYFDEAGPENENQVIKELGSPERVAAIIKADLNLSGNEQAEYTEKGYSDGRSGVNPNTPATRKQRKGAEHLFLSGTCVFVRIPQNIFLILMSILHTTIPKHGPCVRIPFQMQTRMRSFIW